MLKWLTLQSSFASVSELRNCMTWLQNGGAFCLLVMQIASFVCTLSEKLGVWASFVSVQKVQNKRCYLVFTREHELLVFLLLLYYRCIKCAWRKSGSFFLVTDQPAHCSLNLKHKVYILDWLFQGRCEKIDHPAFMAVWAFIEHL